MGIESSKSGSIEPSSYEEDTILGEYLRAIRRRQQGHGTPIDLTTGLMPQHLSNELRQLLSQAGKSPEKCELQESDSNQLSTYIVEKPPLITQHFEAGFFHIVFYNRK